MAGEYGPKTSKVKPINIKMELFKAEIVIYSNNLILLRRRHSHYYYYRL
ncbi:hypothetical protein HMPREF9136_2415 [Prevotella dentalis DSM 3688]|uniref:Uncharacterized protein n=1 Tax=Prevotella dentalis (strain ATCC 49559 / DSM 3688 / JCM 13448 / NCTC 12043 / ES 2772) TaxID=908937 RepID=F9D6D7_PREDD|nr:hypothetical protein HMPREF9136_2415 [Prevotella dentalis DSM 3688]